MPARLRASSPRRTGVVLFSGAGGSSTALRRVFASRGERADLTLVNHWLQAIASSRANHPDAVHVCRSVEDVDVRELAPGGWLDLLSASPACTHFSKARGGAPVSVQSRSTPWVIPHFASRLVIPRLFIENVPEMQTWCRVDPRTGRPDLTRKGEIFNAWLDALRAIGYRVRYGKVNAADYGDPQARERLIVLAALDAEPKWPEATHGPPGSGRLPYRTAAELIDFRNVGLPVGHPKKRLRSAATFERIAYGLEEFGGEPFLIRRPQFDNTAKEDCKPLDRPIFTVLGGSTDIALITPRGRRRVPHHRALGELELKRAFSFPDDYVILGSKKKDRVLQIGNAVPLGLGTAFHAALLETPFDERLVGRAA